VQADGAILLAKLKPHRRHVRKIVLAEVGRCDESLRFFVGIEVGLFLFHILRSMSEAFPGELNIQISGPHRATAEAAIDNRYLLL